MRVSTSCTLPFPNRLTRAAKALFYLHFATLIAVTAGCGGGGSSADSEANDAGSSETSSRDTGEVSMYITDAEGDFVSYTVDVTSISLVKSNGAEVETLPLNTRIDFAEYTDLTEFFTIQTLPAGVYTQVKLNLDYSDASIVVQDDEGNTQSASVVDSEGNAITDYTVQVQLADSESLVIKKGVPAKLALDFDLDSSNSILSYDPAVVEVEPILLASTTLDTTREHRARGLLQAVDTAAQQFTMVLKPFRLTTGGFGSTTITSAGTTHFDINGQTYTGGEGLSVLATLDAETPLVVFGEITDGREMNASNVIAGSSVPWVGRDSARGIVIAREGDTLTLRGSHVERSNGSVTFYDNIEVQLGTDTRVTGMAGSGDTLNKDDVSIGQRVVVFGEMSGESSGNFVMDASEGHVGMMMNLIKGEVTSVSPLQIDLRWVNGRRISLFDFDGTGSSVGENSNPDAYEISTGTLALDNLSDGDWIKVRGYPAAFGSAPTDFSAQTVVKINTDQRAAAMNIQWAGRGSSAPFVTLDDTRIVVDASSAHQKIVMAGVPLDGVEDSDTQVTLQPVGDIESGLFAIKVAGEPAIQLFKDFTNYSAALDNRVAEGLQMKRIVSLGRYDQTEDTMHAAVITARLMR